MSSQRTTNGVEVGELRAMAGMFSLIFALAQWNGRFKWLGAMWFGSLLLLVIWISWQDHTLDLYKTLPYPKHDKERAEKDLRYYIDYVNGFALHPRVEKATRIGSVLAVLWASSLLAVIVLSIMDIAGSQ